MLESAFTAMLINELLNSEFNTRRFTPRTESEVLMIFWRECVCDLSSNLQRFAIVFREMLLTHAKHFRILGY
jgi:hypothetical protein